MTWVKKGHIFSPTGDLPWSQTHAQVPVAEFLGKENALKVYFSTRDKEGRSLPSWVKLDADNPKKILEVASEPILGLGELGTFDDCGVMPSWVIDAPNGEKYLYYIGWNVRNTIPYHNAIGLAISRDGGNSFERFSKGPLWDRDFKEPHYSGTSCVVIENGLWRNYYLSCTEWVKVNGKSEPRYHLKIAESADGIHWNRTGKIAIDYLNEEEGGIVKASVYKEGDKYMMVFAFRKLNDYRSDSKQSYRLGWAQSADGLKWERMGRIKELDLGPEAWDSQMLAYPHVLEYKGRRIMFYNGNGFGQSGFGYCEWKK